MFVMFADFRGKGLMFQLHSCIVALDFFIYSVSPRHCFWFSLSIRYTILPNIRIKMQIYYFKYRMSLDYGLLNNGMI